MSSTCQVWIVFNIFSVISEWTNKENEKYKKLFTLTLRNNVIEMQLDWDIITCSAACS